MHFHLCSGGISLVIHHETCTTRQFHETDKIIIHMYTWMYESVCLPARSPLFLFHSVQRIPHTALLGHVLVIHHLVQNITAPSSGEPLHTVGPACLSSELSSKQNCSLIPTVVNVHQFHCRSPRFRNNDRISTPFFCKLYTKLMNSGNFQDHSPAAYPVDSPSVNLVSRRL